MTISSTTDLHRLFYPRNIAVVGASTKPPGPMWGGNTYLEGPVHLGFTGQLFPIHPKADSILGFKAYRSVLDVPDEIDLVIFSVPYPAVLPVMKDCVEKGVKFVHLFTAGFSETGRRENAELEKELLALAKKGGIRIIGPNCMGIYCPDGGVSWSKEFPFDRGGNLAFISQSGQLAGHFISEGSQLGLTYSKVVSYGNAIDLQAHDFLSYLAADGQTRIIGMYIEGLRNGRAFFEIARQLTRKKPLVVWKGGQTEGGARAIKSHTAAIAGSQKIWQGLCRQAGIIPVNSLEEMASTIAVLRKPGLPAGVNVAILGGAGGGSVTMTDAAEKEGLRVPALSEESIRGLEKFVPIQGNSVQNPLDIMGALFQNQENYLKIIHILRDDPRIDALIFSQNVDMFQNRGGRMFIDLIIGAALLIQKELRKPMFVELQKSHSLEGESFRMEALEKYNRAGVPVFETFSLAARALFNLSQYQAYLQTQPEEREATSKV